MAKFVSAGRNSVINIDQITTIWFHPEKPFKNNIVLHIYTVNDGLVWTYDDTDYDRKSLRKFIDDIHCHYELTDQPPSFWELISDIDDWLKEGGY